MVPRVLAWPRLCAVRTPRRPHPGSQRASNIPTLHPVPSPHHHSATSSQAVKVLIACGANPNQASTDGKTPLQSAAEEGHMHVVAAIQTAVAAAGSGAAGGAAATAGPAGAAAAAAAVSKPTYVAPAAPTAGKAAGGAGTASGKPLPPMPVGSRVPTLVGNPFGYAFTPLPPVPPATAPSATTNIIGGPLLRYNPGISVGGLDFSRGVIFEGMLQKKRANKVMKWRSKYYVYSALYGALFFWTGNRARVCEDQRRRWHGMYCHAKHASCVCDSPCLTTTRSLTPSSPSPVQRRASSRRCGSRRSSACGSSWTSTPGGGSSCAW